jgi:tetratricopeptide (TPR) repeat protein
LVGLGVLANIRGDYAEAFRLGEEALQVSMARGDDDNVQNALGVLTSTAYAEGKYAEAERYARQAHHLAAQAENHWFLAYILDDLGMIESALGNFDAAAQHFARSYALRQEFDDPAGMAITSMHMAEAALHQQQWAEAEERYEHSLQSSYAVNDRGGVAAAHEGLARVASAQGHIVAAQSHLHTALQTASQIGFTPVLLSTLSGVAEFLLQTERRALAITVLQMAHRHRSSNASTRQRAARLLAAQTVQGEVEADHVSEQDLDALVTRLLVDLAIQPR